ncbi:MAG: MarR family winged helix-turn-helix transcriptional regulator [Gammaproteobacteria bacterium]|nr:MarR family winged helix-turn-helix transcriptional regulator [Gammaproteobacteria bacterium]MBU1489289.1 MarR family winged helix-turn-helix transcriptional regulator [Gammaproteobacteria bacterium]MBU2064460.1 MarR family winged helix-turn-helix transcriptional regulator [Gammaproteobacteria bacterium]MBU2137283.1 MarR family winged helix-turn-helix transcriptional regulator [Gammaproteobacteria bacterium]MBU2217328.1 MarR family winged helix-turn-helix transcriptional regulator [Gammaprot
MLPTQCLCTKLRRASRGVSKLYDDALAGVGLTVAQYSLLKNLQRLEQPSITCLAQAVGLERSTLGRNLRLLENKGLVVLEGGEDQRNRLVLLTAEGDKCLERGLQAWQQAQEQLASRLGPEQKAALMTMLDQLETLD